MGRPEFDDSVAGADNSSAADTSLGNVNFGAGMMLGLVSESKDGANSGTVFATRNEDDDDA